MNPFIFWLEVAVVFALLYFVFVMANKIAVQGKGWLAGKWKRHVVDDFPYPEVCFFCRAATCEGCGKVNKFG